MVEPITFPNVEAQVVVYLAPLLAVPVVRVVPQTRPATFVRVLLTGTRRRDLVQADAQVTIECWAASDAQAEALARRAHAALSGLVFADGARVPQGEDGWVGGPYASVDPDSGTPRYVMTVIVRQRASLEVW